MKKSLMASALVSAMAMVAMTGNVYATNATNSTATISAKSAYKVQASESELQSQSQSQSQSEITSAQDSVATFPTLAPGVSLSDSGSALVYEQDNVKQEKDSNSTNSNSTHINNTNNSNNSHNGHPGFPWDVIHSNSHYTYDSGFGVREFNFSTTDEINARNYIIEFTVKKGNQLVTQSSISTMDNHPFVVSFDKEIPYVKSIRATEVKSNDGNSGTGKVNYEIQKDVYHDGAMLSGMISPVVIPQPVISDKGDVSQANDPVLTGDNVIVEAGITLNSLDAIQKQCIGQSKEQCIDLLFTNSKELQSREEVKIGEPVTIKLPQSEEQAKRSFFDKLFGRNNNQITITYVVKHND
jgi:hypothetical protein